MIITEYKPVGITCGELIKKYKNEEITYVGRLDPMAHGLITILTDKDVHKMEEYMKKNKTYKFKFILGMNTDTDDILGIQNLDDKNKYIELSMVIDYINNFSNSYKQKYHNFSSYKPKRKDKEGKRHPMWWWLSQGYEINDVPSREVKIYDKHIDKIECRNGIDMKNEFLNKLGKLRENKFRKEEIIPQWKNFKFDDLYNEFVCIFSVSSGFYIRQFVKDMSDALNVKIIVTDIERIHID